MDKKNLKAKAKTVGIKAYRIAVPIVIFAAWLVAVNGTANVMTKGIELAVNKIKK